MTDVYVRKGEVFVVTKRCSYAETDIPVAVFSFRPDALNYINNQKSDDTFLDYDVHEVPLDLEVM